jgi:hypothetical protein
LGAIPKLHDTMMAMADGRTLPYFLLRSSTYVATRIKSSRCPKSTTKRRRNTISTMTATAEDQGYSDFLSYLKNTSDDSNSNKEPLQTTLQSTARSIPKEEEPTAPVPFLSLFRHGTPADLTILSIGILFQACVGASFAAMNLIFGQVIDNLATPSGSVLESTSSMIRLMGILAGLFAVMAFVGMSFIPYGAARIVNRVRGEYVRSVLRQDMEFFDEAKPGGIVASLSGYTLDLEEGISVKLGEGVQSCW